MKTIKTYTFLLVVGALLFGGSNKTLAAGIDSLGCNASAAFSFSANGNTVTFNNASTGISNPYYLWTFGDGYWSTSLSPSHTYSGNGTYTACLTYRDLNDSTCFDYTCQQVTLGGSSCVAAFTYPQDSSGCTNSLCVTFSNQSSPSGGTMNWSFGDGGYSSQKSPTHCYASPGTYMVCLAVSDSSCSDSVCMYVCVQNLTGLKENKGSAASFEAYPNPFGSQTTITYTLPAVSEIRLSAYDVLGQQVALLAEGKQTEGTHYATLIAEGLAEGIYFLKLEANGSVQTRKVILQKQ